MAEDQQQFPPQSQQRPGSQEQMEPRPRAEMEDYTGSGKLAGKVAIVTGGDSGIGRAVAIGFAKGAVIAFTYSMAQALTERKIRVNCVAPGPVWTPLIPSTMGEEKVQQFGAPVPMQRAAQPDEIAPSYIFFACNTLSSYYTGGVLAPIGGYTLPG